MMTCDKCKYWKPVYAQFIGKNVMACTRDVDIKRNNGHCDYKEGEDDEGRAGSVADVL